MSSLLQISAREFVLNRQNFWGHFLTTKYPENFNRLAAPPVGNEIWRAADYQLAGGGNPSRPARDRMGAKSLNARYDTFHYSRCRYWMIVRDVSGLLVEVLKRAPKPLNLHRDSACSPPPGPPLRRRNLPRLLP
jgi:hypothetical protein